MPVVHYSVLLWSPEQQLHPMDIELAPEMLRARYICYGAFFLLFCYLLRRRLRLEEAAHRLDQLRQQLAD